MRVALELVTEPIVAYGTTLPWYSQIDAVDTQHMEPEAATAVYTTTSTSTQNIPHDAGAILVEIASLTFTATGGDVIIDANVRALYVRASSTTDTPILLVKGALDEGNILAGPRSSLYAEAGQQFYGVVPLTREDTPSAGSVTYRLAVRSKTSSSDTYDVSDINMTAVEVKR